MDETSDETASLDSNDGVGGDEGGEALEVDCDTLQQRVETLDKLRDRIASLEDEVECMAVEKEQVEAKLVFAEADRERTTRLHEQSSANQTVAHDNDLAASGEIVQSLSKEKASMEEELSKVSKQLTESSATHDGKVEQLQSENDQLQERVNTLEASLKKAEDTAESLRSAKARANEQAEALKSNRDAMQLKLDGLQKDLGAFMEDNQSLTMKLTGASKDLEAKKTQLESTAQEKDKVETQLSLAQEAGKSFKLKEEALKAEISKGEKKIELLLAEKAKTAKALAISAAECASLSEEMKALKAKRDEEINNLRKERNDAQGQMKKSEKSLNGLCQEVDKMEEKCRSQSAKIETLERDVAQLGREKQSLAKVKQMVEAELSQSKQNVKTLQEETYAVNQLQERVNILEASLKKAEDAAKTLRSEKAQVGEQVEALKSDRDEVQLKMDGKVAVLQKNLHTANEDNQSLTAKLNGVLEDLEAKETQLESLAQEKGEVEKQLALAQEAGNTLKTDISKGEKKIELLLAEKAETTKTLENSAAECASLSEGLKALKAKCDVEASKLSDEKRNIEGRLAESEQSLNSLRREVDQKEEEVGKLEETRRSHAAKIESLEKDLAQLGSEKQSLGQEKQTVEAELAQSKQNVETLLTALQAGVNQRKGNATQNRLSQNGRKDYSQEDDDDQLRRQLERSKVKKNPNVSWDDIAGLDEVKDILRKAAILPLRQPQLFDGDRRPPKGILLYGPHGTGKTHLAEALATEAKAQQCEFFSTSVSDFRNKWHGESERNIKMIFDMARQCPNGAIIFIDEVDSLCKDRSDSNTDSLSNDILSELLTQTQGLGTRKDKLLLLGATNLPVKMDAAMLSRFDNQICIPLPSKKEREDMLRIHLRNTTDKKLGANDYEELARLTDGASGRDIKNLVNAALHEPVKRCEVFQQYHKVGGEWLPRGNCKGSPHCDQCPEPSSQSRCSKCRSKWMRIDDVPPGTLKVPALCMDDFRRAVQEWKTTVDEEHLKQCKEFQSKGRLDGRELS